MANGTVCLLDMNWEYLQNNKYKLYKVIIQQSAQYDLNKKQSQEIFAESFKGSQCAVTVEAKQ